MGLPISLLLVLCGTQASPDSITPVIYATILDSTFARPGIRLLVISPKTAPGHGHIDDFDYNNALKGLGALPASLKASFESRRLLQLTVSASSLPTRVPTVLYTVADATALPRTDPDAFWKAFYKRFPDSPGVVTFSPVGLSADGEAALVMVDSSCGSLCGDTTYYLLHRREGRWTIVQAVTVRMS